ncbi:uncharacterized protein ACLA_028770 [Aspergillus clavatus NRRL 1]|uniref:Erythromycin esterase n=1 Tax=Aspergillus clavatus (strain ATCC 1007 / CBS 513.65 / DSM 816 / NCTC 3887 / NRRL 1 / QM 1276 / 107) TaxID=344612 RepID=A1CR81_ASPCL|nr:uncharacterized protein ACLA_028770 [Aspergillus clavatus NRRL 1]EAW08152.1 conserved hypothetical protein [Aspergillus clavatus NRRL 1]
MAVRRSARIRRKASSEEPQPPSETADLTTNEMTENNIGNDNKKNKKRKKLPAVMERDEVPEVESHPAAKTPTKTPTKSIHTPVRTSSIKTPVSSSARKSVGAKTPTSAITRPSHNEMHPSKVHQSTTKQVDSGMILGFNPIKKDANGNVVKESVAQDTPSKAKASPMSQYGTPGFEFKFACQESQLSDEAKRLMESVREDVAKIKAQMVQEKDKQTAADHSAEESNGKDRRFVQPKGKANRFSDAHMAEFKKMDSIANHPSAFRATPGRFQPVLQNLKRSNSRAGLDDAESSHKSPKPTARSSPAPATLSAKRVKHGKTDDISTRRRPVETNETPKSTIPRPRSAIRHSLMTPTRASAARASSVSLKPSRTSMIPSLARSPASKPAGIPRTPQTEFNPRIKSSLPTLSGLKSILRRRQPLFSRDPAKIAAGTHVAAPDFSSNFLPGPSREASVEETAPTPSPKKRVEFSPTTKLPATKSTSDDVDQPSPSPSKAAVFAPRISTDIVYPTLPVLTPEKSSAAAAKSAQVTPTIRHVRPSIVNAQSTPLPNVAGVPHGIGNKKRNRETEDEADTENVPPVEPTSDARSVKRLKFSAPSPIKAPPTPSPVKVRTHTPVRPSSISGRTGTPASARAKSRGVLSISRLNMLSQPKNRG